MHPTITLEFKGKIYVGGGSDGEHCTDRFQCYNPDNDSWSVKARIPTAKMTIFAKSNDVLYAIESNKYIYKYDVNQNEWTTVIQFERKWLNFVHVGYYSLIHHISGL